MYTKWNSIVYQIWMEKDYFNERYRYKMKKKIILLQTPKKQKHIFNPNPNDTLISFKHYTIRHVTKS